MNEQENEEYSEISLLDVLVVLAENVKLLVVGPLVAGLLALAIAYLLPQSFVSQAILAVPVAAPAAVPLPTATPAQAAAMMLSPLVLDPVIDGLKLAGGQPTQEARANLSRRISATVGKDGLLRLDALDGTPQGAQLLANAVIDSWLKSTLPGPQDRADMEKRLSYATTSLKSVSGLLERLTTEESSSLGKAMTRGEAGMSLVTLGELQTRYLAEVLAISRSLQGLSRDIVVQPPTLPTQPVAPRKGLMAVLAALGAGVALLLWVFIRQAWSRAAADPDAVEKQLRLRIAMGLKGTPSD